jgi:hypothetical protein
MESMNESVKKETDAFQTTRKVVILIVAIDNNGGEREDMNNKDQEDYSLSSTNLSQENLVTDLTTNNEGRKRVANEKVSFQSHSRLKRLKSRCLCRHQCKTRSVSIDVHDSIHFNEKKPRNEQQSL